MIRKRGSHWVDIINHWSIFAILVDMVVILDFVADVASKWSIFHQTLRMEVALMPLAGPDEYPLPDPTRTFFFLPEPDPENFSEFQGSG